MQKWPPRPPKMIKNEQKLTPKATTNDPQKILSAYAFQPPASEICLCRSKTRSVRRRCPRLRVQYLLGSRHAEINHARGPPDTCQGDIIHVWGHKSCHGGIIHARRTKFMPRGHNSCHGNIIHARGTSFMPGWRNPCQGDIIHARGDLIHVKGI